jgi:aryl-phospho-beta-D-glucosidase BglC (GH1 family)
MIGMNLAGAEFGSGTRYGYDYIYPTTGELDYFKAEGMDLVRLPFKWERVQPTLGGELNPDEVGRIVAFLNEAHSRGMQVVLDAHNYGRYGGRVIGSDTVPVSAFADFWSKLSSAVKDHPAIYALGLMNEPHDMGSTEAWPNAAQAAVNAIRATGATETILVSGTAWSSAHLWQAANANLLINDPLNNLKYEAHVYFDDDHTGRYDESYDGEGATTDIGVQRLQPFLDWLQEHNAQGFIGEFGVPGDDPRWLSALENFVDALHEHDIDGTAWAAGPWWGNYPLSLEPANGQDKPQMEALTKYAFEPPSMALSNDTVTENVIGAEIAALELASQGNTEGLHFSLSDARFEIVGDETNGYRLALADGIALDHETESEVTLTLTATNSHGQSNSETFTVHVLDVPGNTIFGSAANNLIDATHSAPGQPLATAENDAIYGMGGNDVLIGGEAPDLLDGGSGTDTASYSSSSERVQVSLTSNSGQGGDAAGDTLVAIENLTGSGNDDLLEGNASPNRLEGGAGIDVVTYERSGASVTVNLGTWYQSGGDANNDQLVSIENVVGSQFDDMITGNSVSNVLSGSAGADTLSGWWGSDTLIGGTGDDTLIGGPGSDSFIFHADFGHDTIVDFTPNDTVQFERARLSDFGAVLAASVQVGDDVVISTDTENMVTLEGVALSSLAPDDFIFV